MAKFNEHNGGGWTQEGGRVIPLNSPNGSLYYINSDRVSCGGSGGNGYTYTTSTNYTTDNSWYGHDNDVKSEMDELKKEIARLNKKLNEFIDNPDKIRKQREIDPYGEEDWD